MKTLPLFLILIAFASNAQEATIHFDIKNNLSKDIYVLNNDYSSPDIMFGERGSTSRSVTARQRIPSNLPNLYFSLCISGAIQQKRRPGMHSFLRPVTIWSLQ